jgi:uncharacterized protein YbaP (TraB family)
MTSLDYLAFMKRTLLLGLLISLGFSGMAQTVSNSLLWRISGNGLTRPSYLFGTIHMLCGDDIQVSDSLRTAIKQADKVYLELDMDNMFEMLGALNKMKMRGDTTLADLLSKDEYKKVKTFFDNKGGMIPFSILETFKPMLAASTLMEQSMNCDDMISMEQLIMTEAKEGDVEIKGLESVAFQMSIFDSIPYKMQAKQLLKYIEDSGKENTNDEMEELAKAYRNQDLKKLEDLIRKDEMGLDQFSNILLYGRNEKWVKKIKELLPGNTLLVAVGAGHLPGDRGLINLLRKAGYKVEAVKNDMTKKKTKEI